MDIRDRLRSQFGVRRTHGRARPVAEPRVGSVQLGEALAADSADQAALDPRDCAHTVGRLSPHGEILRAIIRGGPLAEIAASITELIELDIAGAKAAVIVVDPQGQGVQVVGAPSLPARLWPAVERQAIRTALSGPVSGQERRVVVTADIAADPSWDGWREAAGALGLGACWSMAFTGAGDDLLGCIAVYFSTAVHPSVLDLLVLGDAAQLAAAAVVSGSGRLQLSDHHRTNSTTGLPNRVVLLERLRIAQQRLSGSLGHFAVVQLAIDGLAQLNDTLGHAAGEEVLRLTAQRLVAVAGTSATVAHIWGVEFAVLVEDLAAAEEADLVVERMDRACREPYDIEGLAVSVGATIAMAVYSQQTAAGAGLGQLPAIARADRRGELWTPPGFGRVGFDAPVLSVDAVELAPELRRGIEDNELSMVYQPIVDLDSRVPKRYEALLRWRSPHRGAVPPSTFVQVAEQTGLVSDLGRYALRVSLAELARLRVGAPSLGISVNVSVRQLADDTLPVLLADLMQAHQLPRGSVTLEVTEGVLLRGGAAGWRVLAGLRECGARIALDDFGTGFSQLSYLRQFWFDEIKIDRSFVTTMMRDVAARAIIVGVVAVADYAGSEVVAEGVERAEQRAMLIELGVTLGQGYLFGAPGPVVALPAPDTTVTTVQ